MTRKDLKGVEGAEWVRYHSLSHTMLSGTGTNHWTRDRYGYADSAVTGLDYAEGGVIVVLKTAVISYSEQRILRNGSSLHAEVFTILRAYEHLLSLLWQRMECRAKVREYLNTMKTITLDFHD